MDSFNQRKKDVLSKEDKSFIGKWDKRVLGVCEKINSMEDYYTTSSCSGRVMILKNSEEKRPGLFEFVSHESVNFEKFIEVVKNLRKGNFNFKQDAVIFHMACRDLNSAKMLLELGLKAGFKHSGIISLGKNIFLELNSTEKIEFPLVKEGKLLVDENFLKVVLEKANLNLKKGWEKIRKLEEFL